MNTDFNATHPVTKSSHRVLKPGFGEWADLSLPISDNSTGLGSFDGSVHQNFKEVLLSSLQMQHLIVLAGSGTSIGSPVNGPSMRDLWQYCLDDESLKEKVIQKVKYDIPSQGHNIEALLSQCEAYLDIVDDPDVRKFLRRAKRTILQICSECAKESKRESMIEHSDARDYIAEALDLQGEEWIDDYIWNNESQPNGIWGVHFNLACLNFPETQQEQR